MARFDDILKNVQIAIPELTNTSASSVYQRIIKAFADVVDTVETEITNTSTDIQTYVRENRFGKAKYYEDAAKAFQYGDDLLFDENYQPYYETIDASKQIVTQASVEEVVTEVVIDDQTYTVSSLSLKVAKTGSDGTLTKLDDDEKAAFDVYMRNYYEIPGILLNKYSMDGNVIKFGTMRCVYSPQYTESTVAAGVVAAMEEFRDTASFNSSFYVNHLEQYVRSNVNGVTDFYLSGGQIETDEGWVSFEESVDVPAGYFNYEEGFEDLIEYVSGN